MIMFLRNDPVALRGPLLFGDIEEPKFLPPILGTHLPLGFPVMRQGLHSENRHRGGSSQPPAQSSNLTGSAITRFRRERREPGRPVV